MTTRPSLEEFSRLLALIHEAAASPDQWTQVLGTLMRVCRSSKASILDIDAGGQLAGVTQIGFDPATQSEYAAHYYAIDPTLPMVGGTPHRPLTVYDNFAPAERARSEYFEFARRSDYGDVLGISTQGNGVTRSCLAVQRPVRAPAFDEEAKQLFSLIAPHVEIARRVQLRVAEVNAARDSLAASLDRLADAAFIVDAAQRVRHLNAAAHGLLACERRLRYRRGRLGFAEPRLHAAFQTAVRAAAAKSVRSQLLALPAAAGLEIAEIAICPLGEAHPLAAPWQEPLVLVMVSVPRLDAAVIATRMRQLYGLTTAEARVVAQLALGKSIDEIAQANRVRESTLRSQLKAIRSKTGVSRQADLVRIALTGAPVVHP